MPSRGINCYSLLRLKLISRSPLWKGSNIVASHLGGPSFIPDIILIYVLFLIVKVISSIILILFILGIYTNMYILLRIDYDRHRCFYIGRAILSTHNISFQRSKNPCEAFASNQDLYENSIRSVSERDN